MLQVTDLSAGYFRGHDVLRKISLRADRGAMISVVGANGAGKTTLLSAICGLVPYVRGTITINGQSLMGRAPHQVARSGVRLVPENRGTLVSLSVRENLQLGGLGLPSRLVAKRIERELERFPRLRERLDSRAGMLSGGEQQMLAIGRAMMAAPRLLLLDEPSQGLAPVVVDQIFDLLRTLRGEDMTIVLVEQDVGLSLEVSDYAYVITKGSIELEGASASLVNSPFVRDAFMGIV